MTAALLALVLAFPFPPWPGATPPPIIGAAVGAATARHDRDTGPGDTEQQSVSNAD